MLQGRRWESAFLLPECHPSEQYNVIMKVGLLAALHTSKVCADRSTALTWCHSNVHCILRLTCLMQTSTCRRSLDDMARCCIFVLKSGLFVWTVSARACLCAAYFLCVRAQISVSMKMAFVEGLNYASPNAPSHSAGDPAFIHSIMPSSSGLPTIFAQDSLYV
jgi:hypothetical protein